MDTRSILVWMALMALGADVTGLAPFRSTPASMGNVDSAAVTLSQVADTKGPLATEAPDRRSTTLQPESRLLLVRYVDGEFAKLVQSLPGGKHGFKIPAGKAVNTQKLSDALRLYGTAASQGDTVQITGLEFRAQEVVLEINGGGKKHFHWRQHLQVSIGGAAPAPPPAGPPDISGATLILDYGRPLPDMSPDDLKHDLAFVMDFSKQHSAAVNWVDTLPPQFQQAIKDRRAIVGMDQEMVIAAMGRPEKKVRERDPQGQETEDWIYGTPPGPTTFVTFVNDSVIRVKQFD